VLTSGCLGRNKGIEHVIEATARSAQHFRTWLFWWSAPRHQRARSEGAHTARPCTTGRELCSKPDVHRTQFTISSSVWKGDGLHRRAATSYVTPYLSRDQITSGTLGHAMGAGGGDLDAYWYARGEPWARGRQRPLVVP